MDIGCQWIFHGEQSQQPALWLYLGLSLFKHSFCGKHKRIFLLGCKLGLYLLYELYKLLSFSNLASFYRCRSYIRAIYAFWQRYLCFLSNVFLLTVKCQYDYYQISEINSPCCRCIKQYLNIKIECLLNKYSVFPLSY